ncbi:hypothetical protein N9V90_02310 [Endozoicomonas sp.]|nr:hypothetical protein [Endozoicomonas sp.]
MSVFSCEYAQEKMVRHNMDIHHVKPLEFYYGERVVMRVEVVEISFGVFRQQLPDVSQGHVEVKPKS